MFKKNSLFILMAALAGLLAQSSQAVIFRGEVWRKQRQNGTYQMIYCLNDMHVNTFIAEFSRTGYTESEAYKVINGLDKIAQKQKNEFYTILSIIPKNKIMILVEDMHSDSYGHATYLRKLAQLDKQSMHKYEFLPEITQDCISMGITVINLECRQNKASMWTFLNALNNNYRPPFEPTVFKSPSDMEAESNVAIQEIKSYFISYDKKNPYKVFLNKYSTMMLEQYEIERKSISQKGISEDTCRMAIIADVPLLDLRAINHIYASLETQQDIVLAMGSAHIEEITKILHVIGYKMVNEKGCDNLLVNSMMPLTVEHQCNEARAFNMAKFFDFKIGLDQSLK